MSYLALARKWRPRRFEDVMGQGHVVKALSHALDHDKLHPAILLTGTRGVGKTTLARIIAKGLNCETGVSANPCGVCSACKEVDEGRFVDMLEIDAASNTGVDNVRDLIDNAQYSPARGRYKVYLIDEVHMLSKGAFNALLKTLEEPPPHVKFILATTDPQKLPVTVLSRCLQFNLKRLTVATIREQLGLVLQNESLSFEQGAITELARAADGSMRDGLSLLDQAIAFSGGAELKRAPIEEMLGTVGRQTLLEILGALAKGDTDTLLACIQRLDAQAPDYAALLNDLAAAIQRLSVLQLLPNAQNEDDEEALIVLKPLIAPEDVQLYYQIAVLGRRDLPYAPDPRLGFEMTVLRMLAFKPDDGTPVRAASPAASRTTSSAGGVSAAPAVAEAPAVFAAAKPAPTRAPEPTLAPVAARVDLPADASWDARVDAMTLDGLPKQLARNCAWAGRDGDAVRLSLDPRAKHLLHDDRRAAIERALSAQLGVTIRLTIELAMEEALASPAQLDQQRVSDRQRAAEAAIEADPAVRAFKDMFGASVKPGSVRSLDS
ncbi:DNA polymerase III subunit gamma/tau [Stenotrophobium rhamnosiphilum]|uniref:DNA polymerase III subunit gamma/tau n=1 Tax=Stenotrophobium rhamnosiphilum TaxID=2029166 RepID=A0A2T5MHP7_9GAMM|nr:DNA polymerase III subunit gamma/tau [Stenotrophobium rhamnosiphilum]PTU32112.1 DNA polymerase III subunit gamma/tau [Stenotrophobium rhamnosiphilum]